MNRYFEINAELDSWEQILNSEAVPQDFPTLEQFGITAKEVQKVASRSERYYTYHIIAAFLSSLAAFICLLAAYLVLNPYSNIQAASNAAPSLFSLGIICLYFSSIGFATVAFRAIYFVVFWEIFWQKNPKENALLTSYNKWCNLREKFLTVKYEESVSLQIAEMKKQKKFHLEEARRREKEIRRCKAIENELRRNEQIKEREKQIQDKAKQGIKSRDFSILLAGIEQDIVDFLLNLPENTLEELMQSYCTLFGVRALEYARKTYPLWKSGGVKMSGRVANRFLEIAPDYMDFDTRFDLIKKIRNQYNSGHQHKAVTCSTMNWREKVIPLVDEIISFNNSARLPDEFFDRIKWLAQEDTIVVEEYLSAVEYDEACIRLKHLEEEFRHIKSMITEMRGETFVQHTIKVPQGTLTVSITQES